MKVLVDTENYSYWFSEKVVQGQGCQGSRPFCSSERCITHPAPAGHPSQEGTFLVLRVKSLVLRVKRPPVKQPRISNLVRGKINEFSIDALVNLLATAGLHISIDFEPAES